MNRRARKRLLLIALACAAGLAAWKLLPRGVRARYTKYEYMIPMRDGVRLFTQVYVPKDHAQPWPILLRRTPFGVDPYGPDAFRDQLGPSPAFDRAGYIFVFQDVRGRFQSEGQFVDMRPHLPHPAPGETDESTDAYDTIEWLLKNIRSNNGRVGVWGMSYPGFYASAALLSGHPAIAAASPQAPMTDLFRGDDAWHNGAFMLAAEFQIYSSYFRLRPDGPDFPPADPGRGFDYGTEDGYRFFLQHGPALHDIARIIHNPLFDTNAQHTTDDEYWQARDISQHLHPTSLPVLVVGGWFDAEDLAGTFRTYHAIGRDTFFVMGPWTHGGWLRTPGSSVGDVQFGAPTADYFRDQILFPFFEARLKGKGALPAAKVYAFETGSNRWRTYDAWPPGNAQQKTLYLRAGGKLSFDPPAAGESTYDEYVSDPANPVPYVEHPPTIVDENYMVGDQRFAAKRRDVLTFVSDPLPQDVTVAGPILPRLHISSSGTDSDFVVKLIDVSPGTGYAQLLRGEPMRAKFRNSLSHPEPLVPNEVTALNFAMPDVNHTFLHGHRIMVQIQSSWFPLTDLNPQKFIDTWQATRADFVPATERVYHTPQQASGLVLPVLPQ
ncbi:MAG TPA: CocE/NonD family hydrolase [Acidobacteriaceae bacterium]|nr:CocE/NonD family hydrolase [Acidobacteriaceae bacterium]